MNWDGRSVIYVTSCKYEVILNVFQVTKILTILSHDSPDGMVCFFPSYSYEKQVIERWQETGELQKIQRKKSMFREPKEATDLDQMFRKYSQAIHQPSPEEDHDQVRESSNIPTSHNGAILFCVVGGKMSEGINFSDRLAR